MPGPITCTEMYTCKLFGTKYWATNWQIVSIGIIGWFPRPSKIAAWRVPHESDMADPNAQEVQQYPHFLALKAGVKSGVQDRILTNAPVMPTVGGWPAPLPPPPPPPPAALSYPLFPHFPPFPSYPPYPPFQTRPSSRASSRPSSRAPSIVPTSPSIAPNESIDDDVSDYATDDFSDDDGGGDDGGDGGGVEEGDDVAWPKLTHNLLRHCKLHR